VSAFPPLQLFFFQQTSTKKKQIRPVMLSSSATLESRLHTQERKVEERRRALAQRKEQLSDEQRRALQAEAEAIELTKEIEGLELALAERRRVVESRLGHLNREEDGIVQLEARAQDELRAAQEKHGNAQLELDAGWRRLEEAIAAHDSHVTAEQARIRRLLAEADTRHNALREKQRQLLDRESAVASRERALDLIAATMTSLDRLALERMQSELKQREELLESHKNDFRSAQSSPIAAGRRG
jgi:chromosome segregation ATPase